MARILNEVKAVPSVRAAVFATNSARRPAALPACGGIQVRYLAQAGKPLRTAPYHDLPGPGAVAGDQLPTDGILEILAYRLNFSFLHYMPRLTGVPLGPALCTAGASWCVRCCSGGQHRLVVVPLDAPVSGGRCQA